MTKAAAGGFSLLETMIAVAILGVAMAVAVPSLLPTVQKAQLDGSTEKIAAFIAHARAEALASRRCVRVFITAPRTLTMQKLNTFDCDDGPATAPLIGAGAVWNTLATLDLEKTTLTLTMPKVPGDLTAGVMPGGVANELRFRSTGRLWSAGDPTIAAVTAITAGGEFTDDDVMLRVTHANITPTAQGFKNVLIEQNGLICVIPRGQAPVSTGTDLRCPCDKNSAATTACPAT